MPDVVHLPAADERERGGLSPGAGAALKHFAIYSPTLYGHILCRFSAISRFALPESAFHHDAKATRHQMAF